MLCCVLGELDLWTAIFTAEINLLLECIKFTYIWIANFNSFLLFIIESVDMIICYWLKICMLIPHFRIKCNPINQVKTKLFIRLNFIISIFFARLMHSDITNASSICYRGTKAYAPYLLYVYYFTISMLIKFC